MTSVYYVPRNQENWFGRGNELAKILWERGIFLEDDTTAGLIEALPEGQPFPECKVDISQQFAGMGLNDGLEHDPVPNYLYDISCPVCDSNVNELTYDAWADETSVTELMDRTITCPSCQSKTRSAALKFAEPMCFARFYIWVSDCDQESWPPEFRELIEETLGPCDEFWEWST